MKINRQIAEKKLNNLYDALAKCGIEDMDIVEGDTHVSLVINAWNCVDGSDVSVSIVFDELNDYKVEVIAEPQKAIQALFDKYLGE